MHYEAGLSSEYLSFGFIRIGMMTRVEYSSMQSNQWGGFMLRVKMLSQYKFTNTHHLECSMGNGFQLNNR
ncbi:hypothetical protein TUM4445_31890 [Shewanella sp. MBTL60-112-B2]|nr:hypothetical protein TUM4444_20680 [Shewanella sp. MBTL60-112-B1]GIU38196.1 hypothetical protein TUM4445_31890 [Shewanella sp. MBTL60-112-B2]